ncbi:MAG: retropepsin-like domain-containing protein [Thermoplasmata archaeon]|nr:retropepsin-like domain-containing protein [Thermoplasmata archaeon]
MPRITLTVNKSHLELVGQVYSPKLTGGATVKFMIDTGSSVTILSLRDAEMMGIDGETLPRSPQKSVGYGGPMELRILENVMLVFAADDVKAKAIELRTVAVQYSPLKDKRVARMLYSVPTVLGTDALTAGEMTLWADWKLAQAHLDYID